MKIGIDVDGVIAKFQEAFLSWHNDVNDTNYTIDEITHFNFSRCFEGTETEWNQKVVDFYNSEWFDAIEPVAGSKEAVSRISVKHGIQVVTSRLSLKSGVTNRWLARHFPTFEGIHYTERNPVDDHGAKSTICKRLGLTVIIEDSAHHAEDCAINGIRVLLLDKPWNRRLSGERITRVQNWTEIEQELT